MAPARIEGPGTPFDALEAEVISEITTVRAGKIGPIPSDTAAYTLRVIDRLIQIDKARERRENC